MKPINNYDDVKPIGTGSTQLPIGGYVLKIQNVRYEEGQNGGSDRLTIMFDVDEGEQKGFFKSQYEANDSEDKKWKGKTTLYCPKDDGTKEDEWTKRKFKTFTNAIEDSNSGYKWAWDENTLKGKIFGGVYGEIYTVIDGKEIKYHALQRTVSVSDIRNGKFEIPKPQLKNGATGNISSEPSSASNDFVSIPAGADEEIPF